MSPLKPVSHKILIKVFEHEGFVFTRSHGDHFIYTKPGVPRPLVIPAYEDVPVFIIKNLLRSAGITRERYFEILQS